MNNDVIPLNEIGKIGTVKVYNQAYVDNQQKRIEELEHKLEQTEKDLVDYQFNYPKIKELEQENNNLLDVINNQDVKIAALEKKNEELKKRLVFARAEFQRQYKENEELKAFRQDCIKLTEDNVVMARQRAETSKQLTRAKELLEQTLPYLENLDEEGDELYDGIEQFLKEIEK